MLQQWFRVFHSVSGVLTDYSIEAQNDTVPLPLVAATDYVYIGQYFPFNNVYVELSAVNALPSVMSVQYWNGKSWIDGVDVLDATKLAGATLARSGVFQFSPDKDFSWVRVDDTSKQGNPSELLTKEIYDLYWIRLKVSADLTAGTIVKRLGYAFATSPMLAAIDPEIDQYLVPWGGSSKTNWNEQIQLASVHLVSELKSRGIVQHAGNVLRFDDVALATAYRTLAVIYGPLGQAFDGRRKAALDEYFSLLNIKRFTVDTDNNGRVDRGEISSTVGQMIR